MKRDSAVAGGLAESRVLQAELSDGALSSGLCTWRLQPTQPLFNEPPVLVYKQMQNPTTVLRCKGGFSAQERIIESLRLEKISKIIRSNRKKEKRVKKQLPRVWSCPRMQGCRRGAWQRGMHRGFPGSRTPPLCCPPCSSLPVTALS